MDLHAGDESGREIKVFPYLIARPNFQIMRALSLGLGTIRSLIRLGLLLKPRADPTTAGVAHCGKEFMNLLGQIRRLLSRDCDVASSALPVPNKGLAALTHRKPIDAGHEYPEPDTIDDDELTVPELPIINADIRLAEETVGFDPYDSAGKPGTN